MFKTADVAYSLQCKYLESDRYVENAHSIISNSKDIDINEYTPGIYHITPNAELIDLVINIGVMQFQIDNPLVQECPPNQVCFRIGIEKVFQCMSRKSLGSMYKYKATILNDSTYYFELTAFMSKAQNDENEL
jgi:hypothetical protein